MKTKTAIQIIEQASRLFFPDCVILLFGSRAKNEYTPDSDYDFLIIIQHELSIEQKREYKAKIRKILARQKIPADILIQSDKEIEIKKNITGHIVKQALQEGIEI
ncbi:MAG: nucleotidyltransferase domain-containing protein [Bacteroidetes bacterium]|nr:MAG: nucleotidyltransferase domain-containing protein [Bacteroidota bacterium]